MTRRYTDCAGVAEAIRDMVVRGAPAIGVAAAYGVVLAARQRHAESPAAWRERIEADFDPEPALLDAARSWVAGAAKRSGHTARRSLPVW